MIGTIIQARMGSTRLPGKVMMEIKGKPILFYVLNQVRQSKLMEQIIVATTDMPEDDVIAKYIQSLNIKVFRGNSEDVLDRFYQCAKMYNLKTIIRISADSPLIDFTIIDKCIKEFKNGDYDYLSNTIVQVNDIWRETYNGFPIGLAVEIFNFDSLERAWKNTKEPSDREHVTEYMWKNPTLFKIGNIKNSEDLSKFRLVIDYKSDYFFVKSIMEQFPNNEIFTLEKLRALLSN